MRWTLALIAATAMFPRLARASDTGIRVERGAGTETCPDASTLTRAVDDMRGRSREPRTSSYHVTFSLSDTSFEARIESLRDHTVRSLTDASQTCAALARATAVTLALLLDADAAVDPAEAGEPAPNGAGDAPSAPPNATQPRATDIQSPPPPHHSPAPATRAITWHAAGGVLVGAIRSAAPLLTAGGGLELRTFSANIGVAWASPGELDLSPGKVSTSFLGIALESCVALARAGSIRMDLCSGLLAGLVRAEAVGYTRNDARSRAWLSIPLGLSASTDLPGLRLGLHASALVPVRRQEFRVDGLDRKSVV